MDRSFHAWLLVSFALACRVAAAEGGADVLRVGTATVDGGSGTVRVPVYLEDVPGTPLGIDQAPDHRISALAFEISYGLNQCVDTVDPFFDFSTGVLASGNSHPVFVALPRVANTLQAFLVSYGNAPIALTQSGPPGDRLGDMVFRLDDCGAQPIFLAIEPSGQAGATLYSFSGRAEIVNAGTLEVVDGWIAPPGFVVATRTPTPAPTEAPAPVPQIASVASIPALDAAGRAILALALCVSALWLARRV